MATIAEALALAVQYHRYGAFQQAEHVCRQILAVNPQQVDALHLLGVVACQLGNHNLAIECLSQALHLKPDLPVAHYSLGIVFKARGQVAQAAAHYQQAIRLRPDYAEAHNRLGDIQREQGRLDEALASLQEAVRLKPDYPEAHMSLATLLRECGQLDEALASLREAVRLKPGYSEAHTNLGTLLRERGQLDEAVASYQEAVRLSPNFAPAHNNLAVALKECERFDEALACYQQAIRVDPNFTQAHYNLGNLLSDRGRPEEALASYREALRLNPSFAKAHINVGTTLLEMGNVEEALAGFEYALRFQDDNAEVHFNRGVALLLLGRLAEGWPEYEWRLRCKDYPKESLPLPIWDGSALKGKTILLDADQGLGDTLQFIRYAALVKERGATVVVASPRLLLPLLAGCRGIDQLLPKGANLPAAVTVQAQLPSLPGIFGTTLETVPASIPYLTADPERLDFWHQELASWKELKVGIVWKGSSANLRDRHRSVPLTQFAPLGRLEGIRLFSLQVGPGSEQLAALGDLFPVTDLAGRFDASSFADAAAVVKNLDLVVTVDTAIAHLAGALGVPTWVALPFAPDWRWQLDREDTPWYPTLRLFRQRTRGNWDEVFERMAAELAGKLASSD